MLDEVQKLAVETIKMSKQALIFLPSRASAEKTAEDISKLTSTQLPELEKEALQSVASPTKQCRRLSNCIRKGIAFHHSGLVSKQKELIEDGFKSGKIKIICCTPTLCLSGDTQIWQPQGSTRVKNFKKSELFALSQSKLRVMKAKNVQRNKNSQKLIEITSVSGHSIKLTPNHKILIKRDNRKQLIPASECKIRDKIATIGKLNLPNTFKPKMGDFVIDNELPFKNRTLTELEFYFIGSMLGDGHSGSETKNQKIIYKGSPAFTSSDSESIDVMTKISKGFCSISQQRPRLGSISLVMSKTKWFREFLCRCGVDIGVNKHIDTRLMQADLKLVKHLLRGLFDTDGCVENLRNISFSSISITLIKDVQKLLLRFGITTRLRERPAGFMQILAKKCRTKRSYELLISQNRSIFLFHELVGFDLHRKAIKLGKLVGKISTPKYLKCKKCKYTIYKEIFSGRSQNQKDWGLKKKKVIQLLGEKGQLGSREIERLLAFVPRHKSGNRLNHHYELISKRRVGSRSKTEWLWELNQIGVWIHQNILKEQKSILELFNMVTCPLCEQKTEIVLRKKWRDSDFEGDIFWDYVRNAKRVKAEEHVYDVILPESPKNDHMFVANGFIVHNSAGLSLPAFRVIIKSLKRYSGSWGMDWIPVLEYLQMAGRAGRPEYEAFGEAIIIAKDEKDKEEIYNRYILGVPEDIYSKLAVEPVLRTYLLSLIASGIIRDDKSMQGFFGKTFWAQQFKDMKKLESIMDKMLGLLDEWQFVTVTGDKNEVDFVTADSIDSKRVIAKSMRATILGKRISELYLDPLTAKHLLDCLENFNEEKTVFSLLQMVCHTLELRPLLQVKVREQDLIQEELVKRFHLLLEKEPSAFDLDYSEFIASIKTSLFFDEWINEKDEDYLLEKYGIRPGEIRVKLETIDWLLYATSELAQILSRRDIVKEIAKLRIRIKNGAKEELLPLLKLKNVGRIRARKMYNQGIKDLGDVKKFDLGNLGQIVGKGVSVDIKRQVGEEIKEISNGKRKGQLGLGKF
jgi:helicase